MLSIIEKPVAKNLLIIEDEFNNADLLAEIFASYTPCQATVTHQAEDALELLSQQKFDLLTLDLMLPGMNGYQFLTELEQRCETVPVVVITALSSLNPRPTYPYLEAVVYKPFDLDFLLSTIDTTLERSRVQLNKSHQSLYTSQTKLEQTQQRVQQSLRRLNNPNE